MRIIMAIALLALMFAKANAERATVASGIGIDTCGQFAENYRQNTSATEAVYFTWAQGFMTGRNVALAEAKQKTRDLRGLSTREQQANIRTYCNAHPLEFYFIAVLSLFESLPEKSPPKIQTETLPIMGPGLRRDDS